MPLKSETERTGPRSHIQNMSPGELEHLRIPGKVRVRRITKEESDRERLPHPRVGVDLYCGIRILAQVRREGAFERQ